MKEIFENIFTDGKKIYTKSLLKGEKVYGENIIKEKGEEYREWDLYRSKLAVAIKKGIKVMPIKKGSKVLYLGASTGTTVSHVSDIVEKGVVFAVEISTKMMHSLMKLAERRENIVPILADANKPEEYEEIGEVDAIFQDVSQKNQAEILMKNAKKFLPSGKYAMLCIKSQSIDVTKNPEKVFEEVRKELKPIFHIEQSFSLEPYDKEHSFLLLKKK